MMQQPAAHENTTNILGQSTPSDGTKNNGSDYSVDLDAFLDSILAQERIALGTDLVPPPLSQGLGLGGDSTQGQQGSNGRKQGSVKPLTAPTVPRQQSGPLRPSQHHITAAAHTPSAKFPKKNQPGMASGDPSGAEQSNVGAYIAPDQRLLGPPPTFQAMVLGSAPSPAQHHNGTQLGNVGLEGERTAHAREEQQQQQQLVGQPDRMPLSEKHDVAPAKIDNTAADAQNNNNNNAHQTLIKPSPQQHLPEQLSAEKQQQRAQQAAAAAFAAAAAQYGGYQQQVSPWMLSPYQQYSQYNPYYALQQQQYNYNTFATAAAVAAAATASYPGYQAGAVPLHFQRVPGDGPLGGDALAQQKQQQQQQQQYVAPSLNNSAFLLQPSSAQYFASMAAAMQQQKQNNTLPDTHQFNPIATTTAPGTLFRAAPHAASPVAAGDDEDEETRAIRKSRLIWTEALHKRFVESVEHCGGVDKALPKSIMRDMAVDGLTRENVASHLQKFRMRLKKSHDHDDDGEKKEFQALNPQKLPGDEEMGIQEEHEEDAIMADGDEDEDATKPNDTTDDGGVGGKAVSARRRPRRGVPVLPMKNHDAVGGAKRRSMEENNAIGDAVANEMKM